METICLPAKTPDVIIEGKAEIFVQEARVFYNPVQQFNRDLSVAVLQLFTKQYQEKISDGKRKDVTKENTGQSIRILEALSATGLRSIRYAQEVDGLTEVVANDVSEVAIEHMEKNIKHNNVGAIVKTSHADATTIMMENREHNKRFQAVDLDPYGCPSPFLDSAVQCVEDGGLLLVTCTDMAVLCGNSPSTCYVKYGAVSLRVDSCHEMALRIVLQCIESHATRYKRYIVPLLSVSADFYVRVFVKIFTSASMCKRTTSKLSFVYACNGCKTLTLQPLGLVTLNAEDPKGKEPKYSFPNAPPVSGRCCHCGGAHHMAGPIWSAPIHDMNFVTQLLDVIENSDLATKKRLLGVLTVIREELVDVPLYYCIDKLASVVKASCCSAMTFRSAILNGGYRVSYSHAHKLSLKTDAPMSFVWDFLREWVKKNPVKNYEPGSVSYNILNAPIEHEIDFSLRPDANPISRETKLLRFQENPTPYWGPGFKNTMNNERPTKREKNQSKKKRKLESSVEKDSIKALKPDNNADIPIEN